MPKQWWMRMARMNNNWLPGALLTMVIISQPKSTGSRPIRDTSVLLFTIHLELFLFLFFFLMWKQIYSDFQARSLVSKKAFSLIPHPLWLLDTREEKAPTSWSERSVQRQELPAKAWEAEPCVTASVCGQASSEGPPPTTPQLWAAASQL